jgi:uncharacterized protein YbjT (DUF2867 family)
VSAFLVTGATGNVGRPLCERLLQAGTHVRAGVPDPVRATGLAAGAEPVRLDLLDSATFVGAVRGCDGLFLLRPPAISRVGPTLNRLIDVAAAMGVGHVTFLSVAGAEMNRIVPHHRVETRLRAGGPFTWTILRPGFFAQNITGAYRDDIRAGRIIVPAGDGLVAFVDTRDIGAVAAATLLHPGDHAGAGYHLTGPRAWSFDAVAELLSGVLGRPIRYERASALGYARHLRRSGLPGAQVAVQTVLHLGLRRGDAQDVDDTLPRLLGRPATTLEAFARDHAAELR